MKTIKCLRGFRHTNDHGLAALTGINTDFLKLCVGFELDKLALVWEKPRQPPLGTEEVCWENFAIYFDLYLKEVKLKEVHYVMDPIKIVEMVDENRIYVAAFLGSTMAGEFEDVKLLNDPLLEKNKETGWDTPIHAKTYT
ncbi:glutamate decarboxylase [Tanacetum coccineum]